MDFSASLSQQQRQTFSPQMQQSLQLLQAPVAELRQLVAAELVCNPVLEEEKFFSLEGEAFFQGENIIEGDDLGDSWRDDFQTASASSRPIDKTTEERHQYLLESFPSEETLAAKIHAQSVAFPIEDQPIVQTIVGNLDEWGYFRATCTEVAQSMGVNEQKVDHVLKQVQQLDPPGVAARDLSECLQLQLERLGKGNGLASRMVRHYLPQLARHHYEEIAHALNVDLSDIQEALALILKLEPHPGRPYAKVDTHEVIPDVIVMLEGDGFLVRLNEEELPRLRISEAYKEILSSQSENRELREYLREKIRGGKSFIQNIELRKETLLAISREMVSRQRDFFKYGTYGMVPLTMTEVAEKVGLHGSTVSRAISGKYIETPRGMFPLKYFFTAGFQREDGESISNEMIKTSLRELIDKEDKLRPLSDQKIVGLLAEKGITVARRTITNYRDQLGILPKNLRKRG
ncbi:MAG: RNA polymerase sigma-54 factor [Verrucomicrobia bacterium RIFCSPHIGHO2_12_FULL_41_10]|nr:MAG: RNA polymerase sigma-54 factor [Verrucomicrobia bacterium RIFCSPHIGHO2_12_FULL_41_10]HLB33768.1 RNA polymerase factor sigma-54 [Chthoniobacterales bacterium]